MYEIEKNQLRSTVEAFFGTMGGGFVKIQEIKNLGTPDEYSVYTTDNSKPNLFEELKRLGLLVCGGTVNSIFSGNTVNDLDFYMTRNNEAECMDLFKRYFTEKNRSINAITFQRKSGKGNKRYTVQLVTRFIGEPLEIFQWFDFTITHGAYDFRTNDFCFGDRFFPDLAKRRLVYSGYSKYPICAMYRTKKYQERGYHLPGATIMHIALSIVQLKIENYKDLKEQLMGIDTMYLQKLLDKQDPLCPVDYGEFVDEAFLVIYHTGQTFAEMEDMNEQ